MHYSLRIGFGTDSSHTGLQTAEDALKQYVAPVPPVGVRSIRTMSPAIEPWPKDMLFDLDQRVAATRHDRKIRDEVDESKSMSREEKDLAKQKLRKSRHHYIDRLHLAHQAIYGADPARQRLIHFWANHFTIGAGGPADFMIGHVIQEVIGKGIGGHFADMAYDVTRHPGMLSYLDNVYSVGEKSKRAKNVGRNQQVGLNDNLAREVMELHTTSPSIGYTEADIREAAKILSGWGDIFDNPKTIPNFEKAKITDFHEAYFSDKAEPGKKKVLGKTYPAGREALRMLIDDLCASEHTARFLARKLCVHFIADNPAPADINHVASAWLDTAGHLPSVHAAMLERASASNRPKVQWPMTWLFTVLRVSKAHLIQGFDDLHEELLSIQGEYRIRTLMQEIGQDFWSRRQPDGFSSMAADWVSPEHFERRIRLASMIHDHGRPALKADQLMGLFDVSKATRALVDKGKSDRDRFILLTCSKEFMGA